MIWICLHCKCKYQPHNYALIKQLQILQKFCCIAYQIQMFRFKAYRINNEWYPFFLLWILERLIAILLPIAIYITIIIFTFPIIDLLQCVRPHHHVPNPDKAFIPIMVIKVLALWYNIRPCIIIGYY